MRKIDINELIRLCVINNEYIKEATNGVKLKLDIKNKYILFKSNNEEVALYKKDGEYFRMYVHF